MKRLILLLILAGASFGQFSQSLVLPGPQNTAATLPATVLLNINAAQATGTATANQLVGAFDVWTCAAACTMTTDTAANIVALLPSCIANVTIASGFAFTIRAITNTVTIAAGAGVTLAAGNTNTVAAASARTFVGVVTNCAVPAVTIYSLGTGVY
jgi:hypothetical protein